jgi:hypothetical protein
MPKSVLFSTTSAGMKSLTSRRRFKYSAPAFAESRHWLPIRQSILYRFEQNCRWQAGLARRVAGWKNFAPRYAGFWNGQLKTVRSAYYWRSERSGWTSGPRPGKPPVGPLGPETAEPLFGVPGTVGISGLADRILSWVQYPESACECGAVWPVTSSAKAGLATAMAEPASISIGTSAGIPNAEPALWILLHMR